MPKAIIPSEIRTGASGIRTLSSTVRAAAFVGLLAFQAVAASPADINPAWLTRLSIGTPFYGGMAGIAVDNAGTTYMTAIGGTTNNSDVITTAVASDGSVLWSRAFDGPAAWHDQSRALTLGNGGLLYVAGNTPDTNSYAQVLVLVYDTATGNLVRAIQPVSTPPHTSEHASAVAVDSAGRIFIAGGTVGDGSDGLIMAFSPTGEVAWRKTWDGPVLAPYSQDNAFQVLLDPSGNPVVLIKGTMGSNHPDYVVVKYAAETGDILWEANWGVSGGDFPAEMVLDAGGDVYVTGTGINFIDRFSTIKLRGSDGTLLWQAYDSVAADHSASGIALDGIGGVYVTGSADPDGNRSNFNDDFYTVKRSAATGALLWTHRYGAPCINCFDVPSDVIVDPAGRVYLAGATSSPPYSSDAMLLVLDAATGAETDRGIVPGGPGESAAWRQIRFDKGLGLRAGGHFSNPSTGAIEVGIAKYGAVRDGGAPPPCGLEVGSPACVATAEPADEAESDREKEP